MLGNGCPSRVWNVISPLRSMGCKAFVLGHAPAQCAYYQQVMVLFFQSGAPFIQVFVDTAWQVQLAEKIIPEGRSGAPWVLPSGTKV
jgi:hypothetical protein